MNIFQLTRQTTTSAKALLYLKFLDTSLNIFPTSETFFLANMIWPTIPEYAPTNILP